MVNCKECDYEGYGIDMVVVKNDFLCPACATDYIKECDDKIIDQKKKIKKLSKKLKKKIKKNNKKSLSNRIKQLNGELVECENWIGTVTSAFDVPEDASARRVLDKISELKNKCFAKDFTR